MVEPGRRCLGDRYELHQLIAAGGMGQVWRGQDIALGRPVAVKVLRSEYTGDPTFRARFRGEAQLAASLSHPNIARVFDYGEAVAQDGSGETLAYLVMELVDGEPLSSVLRREAPLDTATTLSLLRQAAFALAEAHRSGMVHRDVKPGNILVCADGSVKITDFGIAWSAASVPLTRTGQVIGTPQYLSPEQAEGRQASPASDVYALGLVGYECLTGQPAFDGDNAVTIALKQLRQDPDPLPEDLPSAVRGLIGRALVKNPEERLPDGAAFVAAIDDTLEGRETPPATVTVRRPPAVRRPPSKRDGHGAPDRPARRRVFSVLLPLLALFTGAGIAALVLVAVLGNSSPPAAVAAQTQHSKSFVLNSADYVGRPVDEVAVQLAARGLTVLRRQQVTTAFAPGLVTAISPAGTRLSAGDRVTLTYAVAPPAADRRGRSVQRPDPTTSSAPGVTEAVAPQDETAQQSQEAGVQASATTTHAAEPTSATTSPTTAPTSGTTTSSAPTSSSSAPTS